MPDINIGSFGTQKMSIDESNIVKRQVGKDENGKEYNIFYVNTDDDKSNFEKIYFSDDKGNVSIFKGLVNENRQFNTAQINGEQSTATQEVRKVLLKDGKGFDLEIDKKSLFDGIFGELSSERNHTGIKANETKVIDPVSNPEMLIPNDKEGSLGVRAPKNKS